MAKKIIEKPAVSVVIPTFNRANLLRRAIGSVINQSYKNVEVIVVDDGSIDNTENVISELADVAHNIFYLKKSNGGCASARNRGIDMATGEFIAFLDSDDEWQKDVIETLVNKLLETGTELVYSPSIEIFSTGREVINLPVAAEKPECLAKAHFIMSNVRNGSYIFKRSCLEKVGKLNENLRYNEDSDFFQRLAINCTASYSGKPTVRVYHHKGSKSRNRTGIYKALLISSQQILAENPEFAAELGEDGVKRILELKTLLVSALALEGKIEEAKNIAKDVYPRLSLTVKIALQYRIIFPLKVDNFLRRSVNALIK